MDEKSVQNYSRLKDDPEILLQFVNKYCTVELIKNTSFSGFVHSIDPISKSIILAVPCEKSFQITLLPGHAVTNLFESNQENVTSPFEKLKDENTNNDIAARKSKVMDWFKLNLLTVTESNENIVFGNVSILPPYNVTDICTDNPMVAMQVRKIIERMPDD
ncbi:PREDICTED: uncharacterized protein LOC106119133 [Papilio xuthus]|uniref:Uncharacterized protein LOC106119133 n=1 Tax=Papilio xuthus TaxID=66420 RepID=A0AAJ6ZCE9_PAPXU|nr:PREDICTED: uncharacterized protein LOC106119133 [Papilio xuthus]